MKTRSGYIVFFVMFFILSTFNYSKTPKSVENTGFVYDTSINYIKNSRIEITNISGEETKSDNGYFVTYTDEKGEWKIKIPFYKKIMIKAYSNGFIPEKSIVDMEIEKSLNNLKTIVRSQLKKGMKHIEWGSFEHHMLYVRSSFQKAIEALLIPDEKKIVEDYINKSIKENSRKDAYAFAGFAGFLKGNFTNSKEYFDKAGSKLWFNLMGKEYLKTGEYEKSLNYYLKGVTTRTRAYDLLKLAEIFNKNKQNPEKSKTYAAAMMDFNRIIIDYRYKWSEDLLRKRYDCSQNLVTRNENEDNKELKEMLNKAGKYCQKLKEAEIFYYCNEEKKDRIVLLVDLHEAIEKPLKYFKNYKPVKLKGMKLIDKYIYDLQFILNDKGVVEEARKLVNEYPDLKRNPVPVLSYKVVRPLYGPNTLVGCGWQDFFNYKISGNENLFDIETIIIEAFPKWSSFMNQMYGKLWVSVKDGSILRIEWKHQNLNRADLRIRGLILNRIPGMKFISSYGKNRSGLRFPSEYRIIEYYNNEDGDSFERLDITGIYKNYTFFGVDIDDVKVEE